MKDFTWEINENTLEYFDENHEYYVDGVKVPSITEIMTVRFGHKYDIVPEGTLKRAAEAGTRMHEAIEDYVRNGNDDGSEEVRNFRFLMNRYQITPMRSEVPVILYQDGPFAAGRLDLELMKDGEIGLGDLKRTSVLDKEYLVYQLNLYKLAYEQSYHDTVEFLIGLHLRGDKRKLVALPMNYKFADEIIKEWKEKEK